MRLFGRNAQRMCMLVEILLKLEWLHNNGTHGIRKIYENAGLHFGKFITAACKKKGQK